MSCDQVVAGVHVEPQASPVAMGRKLVRRSLSDLAAAGARPWALSWTAATPREVGAAWMRRLARAVLREAEQFGMSVIGGDLSRADTVVLTATVFGLEGNRKAPGRSGARVHDRLCVTGRLGAAVRSGRHLRPNPRLEAGRRLIDQYHAHAMMDLSDGLAQDLPRLLEASDKGAVVELSSLPLSRGLKADVRGWTAAIGEGEDYELLVALAPKQFQAARKDARIRSCGLTEIGKILPRSVGLRWTVGGEEVPALAAGWEHQWS